MSETRIKIKELEMNGETAIRIAECLKKHEPEIWKVLSKELKQALRIHDVVGRSEQLVAFLEFVEDYKMLEVELEYEEIVRRFLGN